MPVYSSITSGLLSLPGADAPSKAAAERLLKEDHVKHHCYFTPLGFHNHLSHHILGAYDLGASASLLQAIYDDEAKMQRPIDLKVNGKVPDSMVKPGEIKEDNWTKWLGDRNAYHAYVAFFSGKVATLGVIKALEEYVFSPAANENGAYMLYRLHGGALHPFIQVGYGLEFGNEIQIAGGLASAATHQAKEITYISPDGFVDAPPGSSINAPGRQPHTGPSVLSIIQEIYQSPKLIPVLPYDSEALLSKRSMDFMERDNGSRLIELKRILSYFDPGHTHEELDARVEELIFASTLLTFATSKPNRTPRLDFFLMHLLTSALFLPSFLKHLQRVEDKRAILRALLQQWGAMIMIRGRPRINAGLLMSFTAHPVPPNTPPPQSHASAIDGTNTESANPWLAIVADVLHAPDSHTVKTLRGLLYGATRYGTVRAGEVVGAFGADGKETHVGMAGVDGTVFVRAAGILMDRLGWVTHGQEAGTWDRSALGWDDAWNDGK